MSKHAKVIALVMAAAVTAGVPFFNAGFGAAYAAAGQISDEEATALAQQIADAAASGGEQAATDAIAAVLAKLSESYASKADLEYAIEQTFLRLTELITDSPALHAVVAAALSNVAATGQFAALTAVLERYADVVAKLSSPAGTVPPVASNN